MPTYKVQYTIHSNMDVNGFVSSGECNVNAPNPEEAKTKTMEHAENNDSHFDPRIDPFIEIRDDGVREVDEPLNTETNTPAMDARILKAAHKALKRRNLSTFFEHGQWWIEHHPSGAQWSVCDASGPSCPDGFDFEEVTQGSAD